MCLVIDSDCIARVFDNENAEHPSFIPVLNWILKGRGSIIYGGKKYKKELRSAARYLKIIQELERQGKVVKLPDGEIDSVAQKLKRKVRRRDFNDEHLVAIVSVARCVVVCTRDQRAVHYLKMKDLYPKGVKVPKVYKGLRQKKLCRNEHIVGRCRR